MVDIRTKLSGKEIESFGVGLTANNALQAFCDEYPQARLYREILQPSLVFANREKLAAIQASDTLQLSLHLYRLFINAAGVNREATRIDSRVDSQIDRYYGRISVDRPYFANYDKNEIYFSNSFLQRLQSADSLVFCRASLELGSILIEEYFRLLAHNLNPTPLAKQEYPWIASLKGQFIGQAKSLEKYLGGKGKVRFRRSIKEVAQSFDKQGMFESGTQFVAVGARILFIPTNGSLTTPIEVIGTDFDRGTVESLARPVLIRFSDYLARDIPDIPGYNLRIEISGDEVNAARIHQALNLTSEALFEAYIYSQIPDKYMDCEEPEIDPIHYGQLVDPDSWIHLIGRLK